MGTAELPTCAALNADNRERQKAARVHCCLGVGSMLLPREMMPDNTSGKCVSDVGLTV